MPHPLPCINVRLLACPEDWHRITPTDHGRHCRSCDQEVVDFTGADAAELAAVRSAAPGGRVCGRFRPNQLASGRPVRFGLWARAFALAVALVFGQGLTAREAWAQTRKATMSKAATRRPAARPTRRPQPKPPVQVTVAGPILSGDIVPVEYDPVPVNVDTAGRPCTYVEQMPQPPGGPAGLKQYLEQHLRYPAEARQQQVEGKVFVNFVVGRNGQLSDIQLNKGLGAGCDEEALRLVGQMPAWTPGRQNGRLVPVRYTLAVVFKLTEPK